MLYFTLLSTTSVMYTVACFYTSKDITYEKVTGVLVVTVLEKDYGVKALAKGWRIIYGKIWVSCAAVGLLESAFTGIIFIFCYLVVYGNKMNLVGKVFVGIGCYLLTTIWIHFSLAVYTVVYFVCKSYHNEDISTVAAHTAVVPTIDLGSEKEVQLERVPV
ncbi:uncharacterized protein LOC113320687 [Papaver somniferum]|uniref:uncharacterized protein LOC113320687 n=1 Tax=Papaver somniferum TaxID=3469 RepID=UPI000E7005E2|nr:uncharacterized protein LOC113320687 [Papaver somniferum]